MLAGAAVFDAIAFAVAALGPLTNPAIRLAGLAGLSAIAFPVIADRGHAFAVGVAGPTALSVGGVAEVVAATRTAIVDARRAILNVIVRADVVSTDHAFAAVGLARTAVLLTWHANLVAADVRTTVRRTIGAHLTLFNIAYPVGANVWLARSTVRFASLAGLAQRIRLARLIAAGVVGTRTAIGFTGLARLGALAYVIATLRFGWARATVEGTVSAALTWCNAIGIAADCCHVAGAIGRAGRRRLATRAQLVTTDLRAHSAIVGARRAILANFPITHETATRVGARAAVLGAYLTGLALGRLALVIIAGLRARIAVKWAAAARFVAVALFVAANRGAWAATILGTRVTVFATATLFVAANRRALTAFRGTVLAVFA